MDGLVNDVVAQPESPKPLVSPCHSAPIDASLGDGVLIGSCSQCYKTVIRINPTTGEQEWLDGKSPWSP
jgi:hypothetical protein